MSHERLQRDARLVERLIRLSAEESSRTATRTGSDDPAREFFASRSLAYEPSVVTVDGERGSGKSAVLWAVCEALSSDPDFLVLPVTRPERLSPGDSIAARVVEYLGDWTYHVSHEIWAGDNRGDEANVASNLERLASAEARSRKMPVDLLAHTSLAASDNLLITRDSAATESLLSSTIDAVLNLTRRRHLLIPIDDPDLAPSYVPDVLGTIRMLDEHPNAVCVVALSTVDLQARLSAVEGRQFGLDARDPFVRRTVARQFEKTFPVQWRTLLSQWSISERWGFRPVSTRAVSLGDLLTRRPGTRARGALTPYFCVPGGEVIEHFAGCLPTRPRALGGLYHSMAAAQDEGQQLDRLVGSIADTASDLTVFLPLRLESGVLCEVVGRKNDRPVVQLDLSSWSFKTSWTENITFREIRSDDLTVSLTMRVGAHTAASVEAPSEPEIPADLVSCVEVLDCLQSDGLIQVEVTGGSFGLTGGTAFRRHAIRINGRETDHGFLPAPRWPSPLDTALLDWEVGRMAEVVRERVGGSQPLAETGLVQWLALAHLRAVVATYRYRDPSRGPQSSVLGADALAEAIDRGIGRVDAVDLARNLARVLRRTYIDAHAGRAVVGLPDIATRRASLVTWYESDLPMAFDPLLMSDEVAAVLRRSWEGTLNEAGTTSRAHDGLRRNFLRRSSLAGADPQWRRSLIEFGESFDLGEEFDRGVRAQRDRERRSAELISELAVPEPPMPPDQTAEAAPESTGASATHSADQPRRVDHVGSASDQGHEAEAEVSAIENVITVEAERVFSPLTSSSTQFAVEAAILDFYHSVLQSLIAELP